jgi:hypothetical protein
MHFRSRPDVAKLLALGLPPDDFAIAGSGPLAVRGWIDDPRDIDVVARGIAWARACTYGTPEPAPYSDSLRVRLWQDSVEILNGWFPEKWTTDEVIDTADTIDGLRFVSLSIIICTKQMLSRPRDLLHLAVLREHGLQF